MSLLDSSFGQRLSEGQEVGQTVERNPGRASAGLGVIPGALICLLLLLPARVAQAQPIPKKRARGVIATLSVGIGVHPAGSVGADTTNISAQQGLTGTVVINEIMPDPAAVTDANGEWVELYNPGSSPVDLNGCTLRDDGTDAHVINNGGSLMINPGQFLVLGRNGDSGANGGVSVDYVYTGFTLANAADEVVLECGGVEVDRVNYDGGLTFPDPTGASMQLSAPTLDNNLGANWCEATNPWPGSAGDSGTPGGPTICLSIAKSVAPNTDVTFQGEVTYTVVLRNDAGLAANNTFFTDTLPLEVDFARWVDQPAGAGVVSDEVSWSGAVLGGQAVTFTFVTNHVGNYGDSVSNSAEYNYLSSTGSAEATFTVEPAPFIGTVVINEIMQNPAAVSDANGEWLELYNPGSSPVDINGCILRDDGTESHVINNGGPLVINPGQFLVLGRNGDTATNGGVSVAYTYGTFFFLANAVDEVVLECGGAEVDRVNYDDGLTFPDPTGASMQLSAPSLDNNLGANWCEATNPWPGSAGDSGTPGSANSCPADLVLNKTVSPNAVAPGQTLTYSLVYFNNGPSAATGVLISDIVPAALTNLSFTSSGATITQTAGPDFTWQVEDLSPGEGGMITLSGVVDPDLASDTAFINQATITSTAVDTPTINNSDLAEVTVTLPRVSFSSSTYSVDEGGGVAIITAMLDAVPFAAVTVDYATANETATAGSDYLVTVGTLTFPPGATVMTFPVPIIDDLVDEPDETISLSLSGPDGATLDSPDQATLTIVDNDGLPTLSINDVTVTEGDAGTVNAVFNVSLSSASSQAVTVDYATVDGSATAPADYTTVAPTTLTFAPGVTSQPVAVTVQGDILNEPDETFLINLTNATNATIADSQGVGTILDDDGLPTLSISDISVTEGDAGTVNAVFNVSLSSASSQAVTVDYTTVDGSATAPADYIAVALSPLTFAPGVTGQPVIVTVQGDTLDEPDETFLVNLTNATNATISDGQGVGTILDDDGLPTVQFSSSDFIVNEGTGTATITATLSVASPLPITVDYTSSNGTALSGSDYLTATGALTFAPGLTSRSFTVTIIDDGLSEPNETVALTLGNPGNATLGTPNPATLTIVDDDTLAPAAGLIYLPLIMKNPVLLPDLVGSFSLDPASLNFAAGEPVTITVVITNQGAAAAGPFWADFFINPAPPPVAANTIWNDVCSLSPCYGLAWYVDTSLAPGQSITLTSTPGSYSAAHSIWPGAFAPGSTDLYLYVDSWNPGVVEGGVTESDETNNRTELHGLAVSGQLSTANGQPSAIDLPPRPARP